jgi:SAM-dependent methyltransferase
VRRFAPATQRNREPIREVLARVVPRGARALEIASGSGEHAAFFGAELDVASWQPSDPDAESRASIDAWSAYAVAPRVLPAVALDVEREPWPIADAAVDVVVCINMIHIAPWSACVALMRGAARVLVPEGTLFLYGPYRRAGAHTAPTNEAFDASLRARDARWGVRDLEDVAREAGLFGLELREIVPMPANNLSLVFGRRPS